MEQIEGDKTAFLGERRERFRQAGEEAYKSADFNRSNVLMAELTRDVLGEEAADSLELTDQQKRDNLKRVFHDAATTVLSQFRSAFDDKGNYLEGNDETFWKACDLEGPTAKEKLNEALSTLGIELPQEKLAMLLNNVSTEDALKLSLGVLRQYQIMDDSSAQEIEQDVLGLCKDQKGARDLFAKVVPTSDYYFSRIYREEKVNDESILKFNNGEPHSQEELKVINISLRLANATWLAAQRHSAKKDGNLERVDPDKRGGVFNSPDYRHVTQFEEARRSGLSDSEAVMRVAFELCKDSWMLED